MISNPLQVIERARAEGRKILVFTEVFEILRHYGIPIAETHVAKNIDEAIEHAKKIGFPVVLKIVSPDIVHKFDVGGVVIGIRSEEELVKAYESILENVKAKAPRARIWGIAVQEMVTKGHEVFIGGMEDSVFGPVVLFGLGGIFVEVLRDVSFRLAPITKDEALEMITELKGATILKGYRGEEGVNLEVLADVIARCSQMISDLEHHIKELDLNPVKTYADKCKVVDARAVLT